VDVSPYSDLDRPPLRGEELRRALVVPGALWREIEVKAETGSTNADVAAAGRAGAAEGLVVVAERQTAGRGRLGRHWESPARAGLALSVLLRPGPDTPVSRYGWLPLLAGVALVETVRRLGAVDAVLKWPNDLLIDERKCAGILAESVPGAAVVLGIGLNVTLREPELPVPEATSLALAGSACTDRDPLLRALLRGLAGWYLRWRDAHGEPEASGLREAYRLHCATLGRRVDVTLPSGAVLSAEASDVDGDGRLVVVHPGGGSTAVSAGDVRHLRTG
jgi:BirA family transcriptional regulator, biotin operon repressor / biotin---[acetyl-CoA-carboxylase] ligase